MDRRPRKRQKMQDKHREVRCRKKEASTDRFRAPLTKSHSLLPSLHTAYPDPVTPHPTGHPLLVGAALASKTSAVSEKRASLVNIGRVGCGMLNGMREQKGMWELLLGRGLQTASICIKHGVTSAGWQARMTCRKREKSQKKGFLFCFGGVGAPACAYFHCWVTSPSCYSFCMYLKNRQKTWCLSCLHVH